MFNRLFTKQSISKISKIKPIRYYSQQLNEYESKIFQILDQRLKPTDLKIQDVSGGCGSMFSIFIQSDKFNGLTTIKQHRIVNDILKDEISKWHGLQLKTKGT
ncbi:unnamed protein product [Candida verbasci]|uniref:Altered inheritance of mitochondria protein 1 n=1 Tax=Candida verbasci TaxID=1227364 RepID=A0A9W4XNB4_9ASCO|nr:unnamed protein product [Candida verbasci]